MKNRKGAALIWMIITFSVLMILMSSIFFLVRQDIFETQNQEERLQTYYIALSGIDLTYAALMDPSYNPKNIEKAVEHIKVSGPIKEDIDIKVDGEKRGTASITIDRVTKNDIDWIRITSEGLLEGRSTKVSSVMRINEKNHNQMVRERWN